MPNFISDDGDHRPCRIDNEKFLAYITFMSLMLSNNRMIAGVCGGLAEWLGWDPTLVRILYAILTVFTAFSGLIVYLLLWIIMPRKGA
jgi:phage shock protein PspC (stress-responsive transcriptional regulator)